MQTTTRILLLRHAVTIRVLTSYSRRIITNTMQTHGYTNTELIYIYIYIHTYTNTEFIYIYIYIYMILLHLY